ncbi:hypothetical protein [Pelagibius sp. 7325]|uniref:hypothetical protein n=1 Tax=Pelagibius sp. 7325 TaxID=3131994 RepID=UPI0030ED884A
MRMLVGRICAAVVATLGFAGAVTAHHGVTGQYDAATPIVLAGTVAAATFAPPHPVLSVRVDQVELAAGAIGRPDEYFGAPVVRPEDVGELREVELSPARMYYNLAERLSVGDRVLLVALRNCLPPHQLRSTWLQLEDGTILSYESDWAPTVDGCD